MKRAVRGIVNVLGLLSGLGASTYSSGQAAISCYDVPVDDASLEPYSHYPVSYSKLEATADGKIRLSYQLPIELVGEPNRLIHLSGEGKLSDEHIDLKGIGARATCKKFHPAAELRCDIGYDSMPVELAGVESVLRQQGYPEALIKKKLDMSQLFSFESIGILMFRGNSGTDEGALRSAQ